MQKTFVERLETLMLKAAFWVEFLATGLFLGKAPFMPGTFGTLLGMPLAYLLARGGPIFYMVTTVLILLFSVAISELYERQSKTHDPGEVVIDEIVGYLVAFTWLPLTWQSFVAAFVLFRIFDILKPFPISYLDRNIKGGLGVVLDDVAAGLVVNILLQVVLARTTWLGATSYGL